MRKLGRIRAGNESGISLVEIMVALALASGVLMALALATIGGVKGTLLSRQNQLAGDMVNQGLERVRALDFADVSMVSTDPSISTDPRISLGKFDPGTGTAEGLIYAPVGTLNPHKTTETHNSQSYDVWRYVTQPSGLAAGTRRLTVVVTWSSQGRTHERQASTFVTATRRGLPLPRFLLAFSSPSSQSKGVGTTVSYGLRLKNYGARDAWNITSAAGTWSYVVDTNKNGLLDATETTALTDSDADGVLDTGPVEVNSEVFVVASETVAGPVGATYSYSWTFRSIAFEIFSISAGLLIKKRNCSTKYSTSGLALIAAISVSS